MLWKAGNNGDVSTSEGFIEYAEAHEELKDVFLSFQKGSDLIGVGWKEKLGYTGESSVQATSFDWQTEVAVDRASGALGARQEPRPVEPRC
eukprot:4980086-Lingulodinium_polyedra.AAC.1